MTGIPGQAWSEDELRACSTTQVRSPLGLAASVGALAQRSVDALGWTGSTLPPVKLLGRQIIATAELVPDAHAERLVFGSGPVLDRAEIATWVWPEMDGRVPPPAARITGFLAPARHWRTALTAAVPFARFANAAIVVPRSVAVAPDFTATCLIRARQFGIAVLSSDGDDVREELPGRSFDDAPPVEHTAVSRWVNEVVYQQLLSAEAPAPSRS
ncbi:hypothetical protein QFW96_28830 [Saccharopolyspora sp. TS4A08]|uniref:Uncharacterized protein n=1 Tax=Saccharopolyspora ipomoeae TaxID=3042027 RepID=A0ABT6PXA7_9PSEU|nr:hypothetical protein [Saccharopolyspora sp. TS4A08]MDI2032656.1 hypothetical protein [Saccharopolyspora sp. TS4A08]